MQKHKHHEVANIFPMMTDDEFESLKADIAENGLLEPVWLHPDDHSIIDGRNRYKACVELGKEPKFRYWDKNGSLVQFVVGLNLHRRHLTSMQKAAVAVDILPMLEAEAKQRQVEAGEHGVKGAEFGELGGRGNKNPLVQNFEQGGLGPQPPKTSIQKAAVAVDILPMLEAENPKPAPKSVDQAASVVGTNRQYVSDMKRYKEEAPEVYDMARSGKVNGTQAKELARLPERTRSIVARRMLDTGERKVRKVLREVQKEQKVAPPPIPDEKYRVWYADPPWHYGNSGVITDEDSYGRAERHYPVMTIDELCDMGKDVRQKCANDAVLFMWVTSPLLEDSFKVINAWGFKYKTSFVWDKIGHNYGHYNSVRHEFLLVCTKGSCTPDDKTLHDSVVSIQKSRKHSEKPEEFRNMIDGLYTHGKRIELFARKTSNGWDTWGNESA